MIMAFNCLPLLELTRVLCAGEPVGQAGPDGLNFIGLKETEAETEARAAGERPSFVRFNMVLNGF